ncbi:transcriptional regulator [Vibrio sinensis]|uniref:Transcriptional regulator n=1 Tax=Vibrio sinensis TaxID=2302434 RepID=A0A3A6QRH1_9VIBR|nr:SoxR reducing system RseC family protein [Vibrio sinensis]RJX70503.1 transcriptional regulator [Vibrio sinensis]
MMTALATVSAVNAQGNRFDVELSCEQQTSCSGCASQKSCGTGIVSKAVGAKSLHWHLLTSKTVKVGQVVEIGLPEKHLLQSAAIVYLVPLFSLIIGALVSNWFIAPAFGLGEGAIILLSGLSIGLGIYIAKQLSRHIEQRSSQQVTLLRILGEPIS